MWTLASSMPDNAVMVLVSSPDRALTYCTLRSKSVDQMPVEPTASNPTTPDDGSPMVAKESLTLWTLSVGTLIVLPPSVSS